MIKSFFCRRIFLLIFVMLFSVVLLRPVTSSLAKTVKQEPPPEPMAEPLPTWSPPIEIPGFINQAVVYNPEENHESFFPVAEDTDLGSEFTPAMNPFPAQEPMELPRGFGSLLPVTDPQSWPNSPIVKTFQTWPNGSITMCSGVLIGYKHVLTAAHCVYTFQSERCISPATSCWANNVDVMAGYDNGDYIVASGRTATGLMTWTAWTDTMDYDFDLAAVELQYPIGGATGRYGFGYNSSNDFFTARTFFSKGFPAESPYDGEEMYSWSGTLDSVQTESLKHNNLSYGGQSGSGIFDTNLVVYGVLSHGHDDVPDTVYTRITSSKFTTLVNYIELTTPTSFDFAIYNVSVSPIDLDRGDSLESLIYFIFNTSSVSKSSATYNLDFYLSTNNIITPGDTFLQSRTGTWSFSPASGQRIVSSSPLPKIPDTFCAPEDEDEYFIGVNVNLNDANPSNNRTDYFQPALVYIRPCDAYEPDDVWSQATLINPNWSQTHDILPKTDEDWIKFTIEHESSINLETWGGDGDDTVITLFDSNLDIIETNNNGGEGLFSLITRECGDDPLSPGTYYAKVTSYNKSSKIYIYDITYQQSICENSRDSIYLPLIIK